MPGWATPDTVEEGRFVGFAAILSAALQGLPVSEGVKIDGGVRSADAWVLKLLCDVSSLTSLDLNCFEMGAAGVDGLVQGLRGMPKLRQLVLDVYLFEEENDALVSAALQETFGDWGSAPELDFVIGDDYMWSNYHFTVSSEP